MPPTSTESFHHLLSATVILVQFFDRLYNAGLNIKGAHLALYLVCYLEVCFFCLFCFVLFFAIDYTRHLEGKLKSFLSFL